MCRHMWCDGKSWKLFAFWPQLNMALHRDKTKAWWACSASATSYSDLRRLTAAAVVETAFSCRRTGSISSLLDQILFITTDTKSKQYFSTAKFEAGKGVIGVYLFIYLFIYFVASFSLLRWVGTRDNRVRWGLHQKIVHSCAPRTFSKL
jgi:hypothetical protein